MRKFLAILLSALMVFAADASLAQPLPLGEDSAVGDLPAKQWELHSLTKSTVTKVSQITGEDSENKTQSRFGVWGVDLGSMAVIGDATYMFGGDTFADENTGHWRSNVLFIIRDDDPSDGLAIADAVTDKRGVAKELLGSLKVDNMEMTVIPTNLFAVGDTLYCVYMSVSHWGDPGRWECRYSGLAKSEDFGQKWTKLNHVQWPGDSNFIQTANCQVGDTMYIWGIPAGRDGGVALMKVGVSEIEDYRKYAYFTGLDESGAPKWVTGDDGVYQAQAVIDAPVGEISAMYNPYLGNFVMTYLSEKKGGIVMREGVTPWGPWSKLYSLASSAQYPSLYGAYMHPKYVQDGGRTFYFAMSQFFPIYNIMWMRVDMP
ncbi:MAG: DUF4185 domain-containing protein [Bacillota bacterium]